MAEPVSNPETGGRSLADILREAGIENPSRSGRRRRWDDADDAGLRQRRPEPGDGPSERAGYGRRSSDLPLEADRGPERAAGRVHERGRSPVRERDERIPDRRRDFDRDERRPVPDRREADVPRSHGVRAAEPSTAAIPGLRATRAPSVPMPSGPVHSAPVPSLPASSAEVPAGGRRQRADRRGDARADARADVRPARSSTATAEPSTGPIPGIARGSDPAELPAEVLDAGPKDSALAWLRFLGELVIAAAVGVGVYFAFTVLWEMIPYLAALAAPVVVTGLVWGVTAWRHRQGRETMRPRVLGLLVFAGTVLTILPAAGLLAST